VVAGLETAHSRADLLHDASTLVPAAVGEMMDYAIGLGDVIVGVAQSGCGHPDQHLVVPGPVEIQLDNFPLAGLLHQHRRPGLHHASQRPGQAPSKRGNARLL
jgi:hypothetical protein